MAVAGVVGDGGLLAVDPAAAGVGVLTSFETGEPALQPARARARQVRMLAHVVPLAVPLRRIVRSVRWAMGDPSLPRGPCPAESSGFGLPLLRPCPVRGKGWVKVIDRGRT